MHMEDIKTNADSFVKWLPKSSPYTEASADMLGSIGSMQSIVNAVDTYSSMTVGNGYKPDYEKVAYHTVCKELISRLKTI